MIVDSKEQKLPMKELIKNAVEVMKTEYTPEVAFVGIVKEATLPSSMLLQMGNTLFIGHDCKKRILSFRAINCDTPENYLKNSKIYASKMYELGFDHMVTKFSDPTLLKIFKYVAKDKPKNMGYQVRQNDKEYTVIVTLGKSRKGER